MDAQRFTIIDDGRVSEVPAQVGDGRVRLSAAALQAALGWEIKPQGLCQGDRCITIGSQADLVDGHGVDLAAFAQLLARPLATDFEEHVAYLGASHADRASQLASLDAPDFTLPDLNGTPHALSDYRGKKVLLVAYASW